ncbi:exodeoxyribonuclease VII small subunit [Geomicrobium sp. JSM 1781026]|uniref:exodeoxyribonuclease VII small subunit n=1 Tax=Geomicrobium sp. JSM 1781026 TaxID=3344580 RepID=UPI0035BFD1AF
MTNEKNIEQVDTEEAKSFEEAMKSLEEIIVKLEEGDVPLEKAIDMYQEGMTLSKQCHDQLQKVEKRMDKIVLENGETEPFSLHEEG